MLAAFSVLADMTWVALQKKNLLASNSNIGGGFGLGDLSDVALMWMIDQLKGQRIKIDYSVPNSHRAFFSHTSCNVAKLGAISTLMSSSAPNEIKTRHDLPNTHYLLARPITPASLAEIAW